VCTPNNFHNATNANLVKFYVKEDSRTFYLRGIYDSQLEPTRANHTSFKKILIAIINLDKANASVKLISLVFHIFTV
jgi:hypothetical protein